MALHVCRIWGLIAPFRCLFSCFLLLQFCCAAFEVIELLGLLICGYRYKHGRDVQCMIFFLGLLKQFCFFGEGSERGFGSSRVKSRLQKVRYV